MTEAKISRHDQILQCLAQMLEKSPGQRITTKKLADVVGVSEAALYRHFPSKAKMYEALINFAESSLLSCINKILEEQKDTMARCQLILQLLLTFTERNPGLSRLLNGDALMGENERLRARVQQIFEKMQMQIKQALREKVLQDGAPFQLSEAMLANLLMAYAEGRISQYVRSNFKAKPTENFAEQWLFIHKQLLQS